jgi:hypothetical protein
MSIRGEAHLARLSPSQVLQYLVRAWAEQLRQGVVEGL